MRVYVPATFATLASLWHDGALAPPPLEAHAVTPMLREWYLDDDIDELEYAALNEAARASLRLLALDVSQPRRRVVLAVDVSAATPDPASGKGAVIVSAEVPIANVASLHVDDVEAVEDVAAAANALGAADAGDADAQFTVDAVEDHELLWYATQAIPELLAPPQP